jgi:hypothetical protein
VCMRLIITKYFKDSVGIIPILAIYALLRGVCSTAAIMASLLAGVPAVCGQSAFTSAYTFFLIRGRLQSSKHNGIRM